MQGQIAQAAAACTLALLFLSRDLCFCPSSKNALINKMQSFPFQDDASSLPPTLRVNPFHWVQSL